MEELGKPQRNSAVLTKSVPKVFPFTLFLSLLTHTRYMQQWMFACPFLWAQPQSAYITDIIQGRLVLTVLWYWSSQSSLTCSYYQ